MKQLRFQIALAVLRLAMFLMPSGSYKHGLYNAVNDYNQAIIDAFNPDGKATT